MVFFKLENTQTTEINSKVVSYENYTFVTRAPCKKEILEFGGLGKENDRQLRMKVRTSIKYCLATLVRGRQARGNLLKCANY